jgi:hypothetical protein
VLADAYYVTRMQHMTLNLDFVDKGTIRAPHILKDKTLSGAMNYSVMSTDRQVINVEIVTRASSNG